MTKQDIFLGIDLGGTKIEIIALNLSGETLYQTRTPTPKHSNAKQQYQLILTSINQLVETCEFHLKQNNLPVGIGIPGAISLKTGLIKNANTTCLIGENFHKDLQNKLERKVVLENDANCFALSEALDGAGKGGACVFGVILGTGVGSGIVINEQLLMGANAIAGEWGHNPLPWLNDKDEPKQACYCGQSGCIETYLSGPGFQKQSQIQLNTSLTCQELFSQKKSQPIARLAYELYVERLAKSLASIINIIDPDFIVLGGGISNIDSLYTEVPKRWHKYIFSDEINTKLVKNQYGDSSGVRGAAWLTKKIGG
ncbi:MAG: ROK family protein [Bermanella sp.]